MSSRLQKLKKFLSGKTRLPDNFQKCAFIYFHVIWNNYCFLFPVGKFNKYNVASFLSGFRKTDLRKSLYNVMP